MSCGGTTWPEAVEFMTLAIAVATVIVVYMLFVRRQP
jgi:hypothetical protein